MQKEKLLEVKQQVITKERVREDKLQTVAEDRAAKAQEMRARNEEKLKQALAKETQNRQQKMQKDLEKLQAIDNKVKAHKEFKQITDADRDRIREEHELMRQAAL